MGKTARLIAAVFRFDATFDVRRDTGTPVDDSDDQRPFAFTGERTKPTVRLELPQLAPPEPRALRKNVAARD